MAEEKRFENKIKAKLKSLGCWYVKYWSDGRYTENGVPDLLTCCGGKFLAIEVKATKGRPSELQIHKIKKIREAGGYAVIAYPNDENTVYRLIEQLVNGEYPSAYDQMLKKEDK